MPHHAIAQQRLQLHGAVGLAEVYDDNLFSSPVDRERDHIWRFSPRVSLVRRSPRLTLSGAYGVDAETFRNHPTLSTALAAQDASLAMSWSPSSRLVASSAATYADAQSPGRLDTLTGLELGRVRGRRLSATGSLSWQAGALTTGTLEQGFMREEIDGLPRTDTHAASVGLERRLGSSDSGRLKYSARRFGSDGEAVLSHVLTVRWSREVTRLAHFEVEVGPRFLGAGVGAEVSAGLTHRFARGSAGVAHVRTQTTVLGHSGPVTVEGTSATFSRQLLRSLRAAGGAGRFRVQAPGFEATIRRLSLEAGWHVTRRLSLTAIHHFNLQRGAGSLERRDAEIVHNTFMIRLVAGSAGR